MGEPQFQSGGETKALHILVYYLHFIPPSEASGGSQSQSNTCAKSIPVDIGPNQPQHAVYSNSSHASLNSYWQLGRPSTTPPGDRKYCILYCIPSENRPNTAPPAPPASNHCLLTDYCNRRKPCISRINHWLKVIHSYS